MNASGPADSGSSAALETAQILAPLLLLLGNAIFGLLPHWLYIRTEARQKHPRFVCCALLFSGGVLFGASFLEFLPESARNLEIVGSDFPLAEVTLCVGFLLLFFFHETIRMHTRYLDDGRGSVSEISLLVAPSQRADYGSTGNGSLPTTSLMSLSLPSVNGTFFILTSVVLPYCLRAFRMATNPEATSSFAWKAFWSIAGQSYLVAFALAPCVYSSGSPPHVALWSSVFYAMASPLCYVLALAFAGCAVRESIVYGVLDALCAGATLFLTSFNVLQRFSHRLVPSSVQMVLVTGGVIALAVCRLVFPPVR